MIEKICAIARQAGQIILSAGEEKGVHEKSSLHDLVTRYDRQVEDFLRQELLALLPEAGFLGEEEEERAGKSGAWRFIVDPIDGTTNFVKNCRRSCTSIALERDGEIQLGVIYDPYQDELYCAQRGQGAWCNGKRLILQDIEPGHALASLGLSPYAPQFRKKTFRLAELLTDCCIDIHRTGSAALDLCDLAAGRLGVMYEYSLSPWDYAAASLIVQEAGGLVTDLRGEPLQFTRPTSVAAGTVTCHKKLLELSRQVEEERI